MQPLYLWTIGRLSRAILISVSLLFSMQTLAQSPVTATQLNKLATTLEKQRKAHHIPGMAIAIVKDNQVIYANGFGVTNLDSKKPVTTDTLFAIGSTTKAFTATLNAMLVDQEKMQWDDLVSQYLPTYQFSQNNQPLALTIRDTLSHRSGYARNDILWANGKVDSQTIITDAVNAESWAPFRKQFHYNNVMYLAAGMASAKASNLSWETLLNRQLFIPLNMKHSTINVSQAQQSNKLATGYMWREETQRHQKLPMRNLQNIAPAGGINSNVLDMSNWLKLQLNEGVFDGKKLVSKKQLSETHSPQIKIAEKFHYGLGWFIREWQGQPLIEHGGNIDGYSAQVALFPESKLGFVLLTNVTMTPLQQQSIQLVAQHLLDSDSTLNTTQTESVKDKFSPFIGEYIGNFGPFKQASFKTLMKDGKPAVDVPGQTVYTLHNPNKEGKWVFELTDTIAISFDRNTNGDVSAMRLHQHGMKFELPKKGVPIKPQISADELEKYLGNYAPNNKKNLAKVLIQNTRLAIDVPGQMIYELDLPNKLGHWPFRINPNLYVTFDHGATSADISHLIFFKDGQKTGTMQKVIQEKDNKLPSIEDILTLRNTSSSQQTLAKLKGIKISGKVKLIQAGISGNFTSYLQADTHARIDLNFAKYGKINTAVNPDSGSTYSTVGPFESFKGPYLTQAQKSFPMLDLDWSSFYEEVEIVRKSTWQGKNVLIVLLKNKTLPTIKAYIDINNGDALRYESNLLLPGIGQLPYSLTFEDYRKIQGIRLPFKVTIKDNQRGKVVFEHQTIETGLSLDSSLFEIIEKD